MRPLKAVRALRLASVTLATTSVGSLAWSSPAHASPARASCPASGYPRPATAGRSTAPYRARVADGSGGAGASALTRPAKPNYILLGCPPMFSPTSV